MLAALPSLKVHPAACEIGDWVLAATLPEWNIKQSAHVFVTTTKQQTHERIFEWEFHIQEPCSAVRIWRRKA